VLELAAKVVRATILCKGAYHVLQRLVQREGADSHVLGATCVLIQLLLRDIH